MVSFWADIGVLPKSDFSGYILLNLPEVPVI